MGNKEVVFCNDSTIKVSSQITFLYFDDLNNAEKFFSETLGFKPVVKQGSNYCTIFKTSEFSFIGIVNRELGSVKATKRDGVLISLVVKDADEAYSKLKSLGLNNLSKLNINRKINIKSFLFTGPEGYRFEVEEFLDSTSRNYFY